MPDEETQGEHFFSISILMSVVSLGSKVPFFIQTKYFTTEM
jgi:hypothetical protein